MCKYIINLSTLTRAKPRETLYKIHPSWSPRHGDDVKVLSERYALVSSASSVPVLLEWGALIVTGHTIKRPPLSNDRRHASARAKVSHLCRLLRPNIGQAICRARQAIIASLTHLIFLHRLIGSKTDMIPNQLSGKYTTKGRAHPV